MSSSRSDNVTKSVSRGDQGGLKGFSWKFPGCFQSVLEFSKKIQGVSLQLPQQKEGMFRKLGAF